MSYTVDDIREAIERESNGAPDGFWGAFEWHPEGQDLTLNGQVVTAKPVASRFGEEGDWAIGVFVVIQVGDQFFRKEGHYRSHDGEYWDGDFTEVEPYQRTEPDFRPI